MIVIVNIEGQPARALIDSRSLCDFMSSTLVDQLKLNRNELTMPLNVQLAVQGSHSKKNYNVVCDFKYQAIKERHSFDIMNISGYDLILGTPFLYQHSVSLGFNPTRVIIGSDNSLPVKGASVHKLVSRSTALREENLDEVREYLKELAKQLCKTVGETPLPPLRAINHWINLINEDMVYPTFKGTFADFISFFVLPS